MRVGLVRSEPHCRAVGWAVFQGTSPDSLERLFQAPLPRKQGWRPSLWAAWEFLHSESRVRVPPELVPKPNSKRCQLCQKAPSGICLFSFGDSQPPAFHQAGCRCAGGWGHGCPSYSFRRVLFISVTLPLISSSRCAGSLGCWLWGLEPVFLRMAKPLTSHSLCCDFPHLAVVRPFLFFGP